MRNNKWMKWFVGIGSVSTVAATFAILQPEKEAAENLDPQIPVTKGEFTQDQNSITDISTLKEQEKASREDWISSLDWQEGNWDVDESKIGVTFTPRQSLQALPKKETRTRRS